MALRDVYEGFFCGRLEKEFEDQKTATAARLAVLTAERDSFSQRLKDMQNQKEQVANACVADAKDNVQKISDLLAQQSILNDQIAVLTSQLEAASAPVILSPDNFSLLPKASQTEALRYWNGYKEANATYSGRYWGVAKTMYPLDVKVFCLEGKNDAAIIKRVKEAGAMVDDIKAQNPSLNFHQICDIAIMRVAAAFTKPYQVDTATWGTNEFHQFASEMEAGPSGDCDDFAVWRHVGCLIAGIPEVLLRVEAGMTYGGLGHETNRYLASDLTWRHINSTSVFHPTDSVLSRPRTNDSSDLMGLQFLIFSCTSQKTFAELHTDSPGLPEPVKKLHHEHPFFKHVKVTKKR